MPSKIGAKFTTSKIGRYINAKILPRIKGGKIMGRVLAITNRKGGCGKTVTAASLGVGLARQGKKTLIIDMDNQHSLTVSMGVSEPEKLTVTLATVITDIISKRETDPTAGIIHHPEGVDLMPANDSLTGIELTLAPLIGREIVLRKYINKVKPLYDYMLLDAGSTLDMLTINVLAAADSAIIPVCPKYLDAKGLELMLISIAGIREDINPNLSVCGILLTLVDTRTNFSKEIIHLIREAYGQEIRVFRSVVPHSVRAAEASAIGNSVFTHDPGGKVAAAYAAFTEEVLESA
jgi:chromosome partitioning protein